MNWTYTDCNSSREIPRYICIFFLIKKNFFLSFLKIFSFLFSFKIPYYSPITLQLSLSYIFMIFLIRGKIFFLFFLFLVFLSYFLLMSSNTPLLFLNFHFHFTLTLQKRREALFLNRTSYIFLNFFCVFVFVFKYCISKSLTSMLDF